MALKPARLQWSAQGGPESPLYGDVYFQPGAGPAESRYVFLEGNGLPRRFAALAPGETFCVAELGFGTGLNFLLALDLWQRTAPRGARLVYAAVEKHPFEKDDLARLHALWPEHAGAAAVLQAQYPPLVEGFHLVRFDGADLLLLLGDVEDRLPELSGRFDAWFLDGFAPAKNPAMWAGALYPLIAARTAPGGTAATFSAAGEVRRGLAAAGFAVRKEKGFGKKRDMTVAVFPGKRAPAPARLPVGVLGAGLAGAGAAHAFARRGFDVTVCDKGDGPARGASGNPAGILYPRPAVDGAAMGRYSCHGFSCTRALLAALGEPSWTPCGVLRLYMEEGDKARARALVENHGFPPGFAQAREDGLFHATAGHVSPPAFCARLLDHPRIRAAYGREVKTLAAEAGITVVALANASNIFPETAWLPLSPLRGQVTVARGCVDIPHVICHKGYVTPAIAGEHHFGATFQKEPEDTPALRAQDHAENVARLRRNVPAFAHVALEVTGGRAGYRATTPDKLPLAGPAPDYAAFAAGGRGYVPGLYISAGFGAHGLAGAPLAGEIIAARAAGEPLPVPAGLADALLPERLILRDLKRGAIKKAGA